MKEQCLTIGFSPCPNDCFIFDAWVHKKIDTEGLTINPVLEDVETLNQKAFNNELAVTKLSYHAFIYLTKNYQLLHSGSALGNGCGPLLIAKDMVIKEKLQQSNQQIKVAIPGKYTTANFLFTLAYPHIQSKVQTVFSEIEDKVVSGEAEAGVIIHENRFTYEKKGLKKITDLGEYWETLTGAPIPLGGIAVKRSLSEELKRKIDRVLKRSVAFAFANPKSSSDYVKKHAQEMDEEVMYKHIDLYVNKFSLELGNEGKHSVNSLFDKAISLKLIQKPKEMLFVNSFES